MSHQTFAFVLVFIGGGLGSMMRYAVNLISASLLGPNFGWGTIFVNIIGSLAMGLLVGWSAFRGEGGQLLLLFAATGILGGFTTFSAFSLDAVLLFDRGQTAAAVLYIAGSVVPAIIGAGAGMVMVRAWFS